MGEVVDKLTAKQAIDRSFEVFRDFYRDSITNNVLLEGVELHGDEWLVTIGFDIGRRQERSFGPSVFGEVVKEPLREKRRFHLRASDGAFLKMD